MTQHPTQSGTALVEVAAEASAGLQTGDLEEIRKHLLAILRRIDAEDQGAVTVSKAAALLELSEVSVRRWIERGALKAIPNSSPVRIDARSLGELLAVVRDLRHEGNDGKVLAHVIVQLEDRDLYDKARSVLGSTGKSEWKVAKNEEELAAILP